MVLALAGDSTITNDFAIVSFYKRGRLKNLLATYISGELSLVKQKILFFAFKQSD
jgi:hypothetical protein